MAERLVLDRTSPDGLRYRGPAEIGVAEFKGAPEQVIPAGIGASIAAAVLPVVQAHGGTLLRTRVWADTSPTWYTLYRLELAVAEPAVARQGDAGMAMPFPFVVLIAVLLVLGLVALAAWQVSRVDWGAATQGIGAFLAIAVVGVVILLVLARKM